MSLSSEGTPEMVAFEQLVEEYGDRVYGIALRITGSASDAEDVMQDAFLQAFRSWDSYRRDAAPFTWLYRITVNAALMRVRARRPIELLSERSDTEDIVDWTADAAQDSGIVRAQRAHVLRAREGCVDAGPGPGRAEH